MARYRCPCCGMPYNGKRCRECYYEPFTEEIAHRNHVHEGEPLVIRGVRKAAAPVSSPKRLNECDTFPGRKKSKMSPLKWVFLILAVLVCLYSELSEVIDGDIIQDFPDERWTEREPLEDLDDLKDGVVLYHSGDVLVAADWRNGQAYDGPIWIYVQNHSGRDLTVYTEQLYVNGFAMGYSSYYCEADAGETAGAELWIDSDDLERNGIDTISEIQLQLTVFDTETYETLGQSGSLLLSCAVPQGFVQTVDDSGQVLYERDGFRVVCRGIRGDVCTDAYLELYLENESGQPVDIYMAETYVNGEAAEVYLRCRLLPGTRSVIQAALYNLPSIGVDTVADISSFELVLEGFTGENLDEWFQTDRVAIDRME